MVTALSRPRRRSSPGSTTDQEFTADCDEEATQETGELSGLTVTGEEESQFQSRDTRRPGQVVLSSNDIPPTSTPPQWFLDGMDEISDMDSNDDAAGFLADYSRKKPPATEAKNNGKTPGVSRNLPLGILRNLIHQLECRGTRQPAEEEAETASQAAPMVPPHGKTAIQITRSLTTERKPSEPP